MIVFNKTILVSRIQESKECLDVCVKPERAIEGYINCSLCWKCLRSLITLDIIGQAQEYKHVFNLEAFYRVKNIYLVEIMASHDPLLLEIKHEIENRKYTVPMLVRIAAWLTPAPISKYYSKVILRYGKTRFIKAVNCILGAF